MIMYVDETEDDSVFIVAGLFFETEQDAIVCYKRFKHHIRNYPISENTRAKVYTEFKATLLDQQFQMIKRSMLEKLVQYEPKILYAVYQKPVREMVQSQKESAYISLLRSIVMNVNVPFNIVFDSFRKRSFEEQICEVMRQYPLVASIRSAASETEPGLQFIDNVCSVIRRNFRGSDGDGYFKMLEKYVNAVDMVCEE